METWKEPTNHSHSPSSSESTSILNDTQPHHWLVDMSQACIPCNFSFHNNLRIIPVCTPAHQPQTFLYNIVWSGWPSACIPHEADLFPISLTTCLGHLDQPSMNIENSTMYIDNNNNNNKTMYSTNQCNTNVYITFHCKGVLFCGY